MALIVGVGFWPTYFGPFVRGTGTTTRIGVEADNRSLIVVRNVFQLKFGKTREAIALIKEGVAIQKRALAGVDFSTRLLTDVTGSFYTVVLELTVPNLATFESSAPRLFGDPTLVFARM
jgi:hypothetical protein